LLSCPKQQEKKSLKQQQQQQSYHKRTREKNDIVIGRDKAKKLQEKISGKIHLTQTQTIKIGFS
jgi:hypothetical protein